MIRPLFLTAVITAANLCGQKTKVPESKPELPGPGIPLCARFPGGPVIILDGSGNLRIVYKPEAADSAPRSLEALKSQYEASMSRLDITVQKLPNGGTATNGGTTH